MAKTKRYAKKYKSRKVKRGGRKNNNTALKMSQMVGGQQPQPRPAPAPASRLNLNSLDEQSVIDALQSFGDAARGLKSAVAQGLTTVDSLRDAVTAQRTAIVSLGSSADSLDRAITGTNGLYSKILAGNPTFVATPEPPAPAPAPIPL